MTDSSHILLRCTYTTIPPPMSSHTLLNGVADGDAVSSTQKTPLSGQLIPHQQEKNLPGGWIVQKFGGTSMGKFAVNIAGDIVETALKKNRIAVVCSARSSNTKAGGPQIGRSFVHAVSQNEH